MKIRMISRPDLRSESGDDQRVWMRDEELLSAFQRNWSLGLKHCRRDEEPES